MSSTPETHAIYCGWPGHNGQAMDGPRIAFYEGTSVGLATWSCEGKQQRNGVGVSLATR